MTTKTTREQAQQELAELSLVLARHRLLAFTSHTNPLYRPNWHHARLAQELDDVLAGKTTRLMVFMPPQHGKSELVSRRFPAFALGVNPNLRLVACSFGQSLATDMSKDVQNIIDDPLYRQLFPRTRLASERDDELRQASRFGVPGYAGYYISAGVQGPITGKSMDIGIIDDPVKDRQEAESPTIREAIWGWYKDVFLTRGVGDGQRIVLTMTRWHEDDLAGRLLRIARENPQTEQWRVVKFPAICEEPTEGDPRQRGEILWPSNFSARLLESKRIVSGVYSWSALYQQSPVPAGGALAQRAWFRILPTKNTAGVIYRCRAWDCASTLPGKGKDPDWTVGTLMGQLSDGRWLIEDVIRVQLTPRGVDDLILQTARMDGRHVMIREEEEGGSSGKSVISAHTRLLAGFDYAGVRSTGEKSTRWRPFLSQAEAGNVVLNPSPKWNRDWLDEIETVPFGRHDDQADSVALAFNALSERKVYGPTIAAVMPENPTTSGPRLGDWQRNYFRRR